MCNRVPFTDPFSIRYNSKQFKTYQMFDKAVDDCLASLNFFPDWLVTSKAIKKLLNAYMQMKIYYILIKILLIPYFFVMKWVFLV